MFDIREAHLFSRNVEDTEIEEAQNNCFGPFLLAFNLLQGLLINLLELGLEAVSHI